MTLRVWPAIAVAVLGVVMVTRAQTPAPADPAQAPPGAAPQATFRSAVDIVDVDVSVLDKNRLPVRGLVASDFTVLEDGKARPVVAFGAVDLPPRVSPTAPWLDEIAPDVVTNLAPSEGRLVVILMDRSINTEQQPIAREIAETAIAQLRPGDLGAVVFSLYGLPQNFTSDRSLLLAAVRQPFIGLPAIARVNPAACYCGVCSLETIANVAEGLSQVRQRRKVLITIGTNIAVNPQGQCSGMVTGERKRAMRALEAANVTVYAFDPSGVNTVMTSAAQSGPINFQASVQAMMRRRGNLKVLPDLTGGRAVLNNDPAGEVSRVFRESASYYVLGFQSASRVPDRRFHDIKVKVSRPDVILQARRGFYAPGVTPREAPKVPRGVPAALASAVAGVWPRTELGVTMQAVPFALPGMRDAEVRVILGVRQEADPARPGMVPAPLFERPVQTAVNLYLGAFDVNGRALADVHETASVRVVPRSDRAFAYELVGRLGLQPGRYEIRAAVDDELLRGAGSVYGYAEVPDFVKSPVSLSGILLQVDGPNGPPQPPANDLLPVVPTVRREFGRTERVTAFVREHQGLTRNMMSGYFQARIFNEVDERVFGQEHRIQPPDFGANRAMDYAFDLPLDTLSAGEYRLSIEARHGNITVTRDLRFRVR